MPVPSRGLETSALPGFLLAYKCKLPAGLCWLLTASFTWTQKKKHGRDKELKNVFHQKKVPKACLFQLFLHHDLNDYPDEDGYAFLVPALCFDFGPDQVCLWHLHGSGGSPNQNNESNVKEWVYIKCAALIIQTLLGWTCLERFWDVRGSEVVWLHFTIKKTILRPHCFTWTWIKTAFSYRF